MKLKTTKYYILTWISVLTLVCLGSTSLASDCNKHPRPGCPDDITNNYYSDSISQAVAIGASVPDLLPDVGKTRLDGAWANYQDHNAFGGTIMHNFDAKDWGGVVESVSVGLSAATADDGGDYLFRGQVGVQF